MPILHIPPHWKTISVISISVQLITKNSTFETHNASLWWCKSDVNLTCVKVSHKDKRAWFGFLSSFTSFWSVGKMYIKKWEPLYSGHLVLTNTFLRKHRGSRVDCIETMLLIAKHINWYIELVRHWYKIRQNICWAPPTQTFWSPKRFWKMCRSV